MTSPVSTSSASLSLLNHKLFKTLDGNDDRGLSLDELKSSHIVQKLGGGNSNDAADKAFDSMDADQNGALSEDETRKFMTELMAKSPSVQALVTLMVNNQKTETPTWNSWLNNVYTNQNKLKSLNSHASTGLGSAHPTNKYAAQVTAAKAAINAWRTKT